MQPKDWGHHMEEMETVSLKLGVYWTVSCVDPLPGQYFGRNDETGDRESMEVTPTVIGDDDGIWTPNGRNDARFESVDQHSWLFVVP